ncbi:amidohydrolase family protein [Pseudoxanthomonas putridarboris]|uniref:Amidohydrolase family protein n=1 Tax=Pseudoxanthomonas putridarboris TaxID=752605 RepID=A0ABU9IXA9_9GAMM
MKTHALTLLMIASASSASGSEASLVEQKFMDPKTISFTSTEFTLPKVPLSQKSGSFYFNSLGEIYKAPIAGGVAEKLELGGGWKDLPTVSSDGTQLAYRNNVDGVWRVWVKDLKADGAPTPATDNLATDPLEMAWSMGDALIWTGRDNLTGHRNSLEVSAARHGTIGPAASLMGLPIKRGVEDALVGTSSGGRFMHLFSRPIRGLKRVDLMTGEESSIENLLPDDVSQVQVSEDGMHVGYRSGSLGDLHVIRIADRRNAATTCKLEQAAASFKNVFVDSTYTLSSDAEFALLSRNGKFYRCDIGSGEREVPVSAKLELTVESRIRPTREMKFLPQILLPAYSASRNEVAFSSKDKIWILDLATNKVRRLTSSVGAFETMPAFSKSGSKLVYVEVEGGVSTLKMFDMKSGRSRNIHRSNMLVHANPNWANCDCKVAFSLTDTRFKSKSESKILSIDLKGGEPVEIARVMSPAKYTQRYHPAPQWDIDDTGVFYSIDMSREKRFVHKKAGSDETLVMSGDPEITEFLISPDYKSVGVSYRNGFAVIPLIFAGGSNQNSHLSFEVIESLPHFIRKPFDYAVWKSERSLISVVQDKVYEVSLDQPDIGIGSVQSLGSPLRKDMSRRAYVGARLITMNGDEVIEDGVIITSGTRIEYVGSASGARLENASIIDVRGKTIIPGIIDTHLHTTGFNNANESTEDGILFSLAAYGVTTVYDPSPQSLAETSNLTFASTADDYNGATYYSAGQAILGNYGHPASARINGIEDARAYVGRLATSNVPILKEYLNPTPVVRRWIVQAAHEYGLGVTSHLEYTMRSKLSSIQEGYTGMEHEIFLRPRKLYHDVRSFFKLSGVSITPTLFDVDSTATVPYLLSRSNQGVAYRCLVDGSVISRVSSIKTGPGWESGSPVIPEWKLRAFRQYAELLEDGVLVSIGSHSEPPGLAAHWEMWSLALGGASPMSVLRAATVNGAEKLGMEDRIGALRAGMDADMVILNSNPLDDMFLSQDIATVVRRGREITWPRGSAWPSSWTPSSDWSQCKDWFVQRSLPIESGPPMSQH